MASAHVNLFPTLPDRILLRLNTFKPWFPDLLSTDSDDQFNITVRLNIIMSIKKKSKFLHRSGQNIVTTIMGTLIFIKPELEFLPCIWLLNIFHLLSLMSYLIL